jgi:putative membrane protein
MLSLTFTILVAVLHVVFMVLETFLWTTPGVRKRFQQTVEQAEATKVFAANQGVYNGALAACLVWSAFTGNTSAQIVLLVFVIVVGIYGAFTAKPTIFFLQALPAIIALALLLLGM